MPRAFETLLAERQKLLVDFIRAELAIGFTFLRSAELALNDDHLDHAGKAKENARRAADSVKQFVAQVSDSEARAEIGSELAKLERAIG